MNYPDWFKEEMGWTELYESCILESKLSRVFQMARDGWDMAYNTGTENCMTGGQFCEKYKDKGLT